MFDPAGVSQFETETLPDARRVFVRRLLIKLLRHGCQNQLSPIVKLAFREVAAVLGLLPKLL